MSYRGFDHHRSREVDEARARIAWEDPVSGRSTNPPIGVARDISRRLAAMDGLDQADRYTEALRVAKITEEAGEAMQALIAYHGTNPRKPRGPLEEVIKELADVALTAKVAIESFGFDADAAVARREREVLVRLQACPTDPPAESEQS